ncbi:hypothetical protein HDU99_008253, partial [Rhizoclosmatium hyalinum]
EEGGDDWLYKLEEPIPELVESGKKKGAAKKSANGSQQHQRSRNDQEEEEQEDSLEITVVRPVKPNAEIFNIYGDHTNAKLLNLYGFAEIDNPNNNVQVDLDYLLETVGEQVGEKTLTERCLFWKEVGRKVVDFIVRPKDDDDDSDQEDGDNEIDWSDSEDSDDDENNQESKDKSARSLIKENDVFHFTNDGTASKHLIAFLHLLLLDAKAFQTFTKDEESVKKYIRHICETGLASWTATATKKGGKSAAPVKATEKPIIQQITALLNSAAAQRLARYEGTDGDAEASELQALTDAKEYTPKRWALTVRVEERRILTSALS